MNHTILEIKSTAISISISDLFAFIVLDIIMLAFVISWIVAAKPWKDGFGWLRTLLVVVGFVGVGFGVELMPLGSLVFGGFLCVAGILTSSITIASYGCPPGM